MCTPPENFGSAKVVRWSPIDQRHNHTGACNHLVGGQTLPPASLLAICEESDGSAFFLFGCDSDWNPVTDTWHLTLDEATQQAEFEYEGVALTWIDV